MLNLDEWEPEAGEHRMSEGRQGETLRRLDEIDECLERMEAQNVGLGGRIDVVDRRLKQLTDWTAKVLAAVGADVGGSGAV